MNKSLPVIRSCVLSRNKENKENLFRVVKTVSGVVFDEKQSIKGRGAYIKKDELVILEAKKRHSFSKALRCEVSDSIYDELINALKKRGN